MEDRNTVSHLPSSILHPLSSISSCLSGSSHTTNVQILCRLERILLRGFFALFASSRLIPDSALSPLRREGRKENAKQIVWLRLGCTVFIGGFIFPNPIMVRRILGPKEWQTPQQRGGGKPCEEWWVRFSSRHLPVARPLPYMPRRYRRERL